MMKRLAALSTAAVLTLAACGGGSSQTSTLEGPQGKLANMVLEAAAADKVDIDAACVDKAAAQFSDADAQVFIENGFDAEPDFTQLSMEALDPMLALLECMEG